MHVASWLKAFILYYCELARACVRIKSNVIFIDTTGYTPTSIESFLRPQTDHTCVRSQNLLHGNTWKTFSLYCLFTITMWSVSPELHEWKTILRLLHISLEFGIILVFRASAFNIFLRMTQTSTALKRSPTTHYRSCRKVGRAVTVSAKNTA